MIASFPEENNTFNRWYDEVHFLAHNYNTLINKDLAPHIQLDRFEST